MKELSHLSDDELVRLLQENDEVAFKEIYNRYWYTLYIFTNKRLRSKEASEEIIQNFFIKFWAKRQGFEIKISLKAYFFAAIRYSIIDHMQKEATKNGYAELCYYKNESWDNSTEQEVVSVDLKHTIEKEVEKLPERCRSVFELSRNNYKSNKEIAQILNISEKTVENHITNAIKFLKLNLKEIFTLVFFLFRIKY